MEQPNSVSGLLQSVIADIAAMTDPLPAPTEETVASILRQTQVKYLQSRVAELKTENEGLRSDITALREENSILRFENDDLLNKESTDHDIRMSNFNTLDKLYDDLINLGLGSGESSSGDSWNPAAQNVKDNKDHGVKSGNVDLLGDTESQAASKPAAESPDRKERHEVLTLGCHDNPVIIEDDESTPVKQPSRTDESGSTMQQHTPASTNTDMAVGEGDDQNTSLILRDLLTNTNYGDLLEVIATIRPGRIKDVHIRDGNTARITFFTREAAEKLYAALQQERSLREGPLFHILSAHWSNKYTPPETPSSHTRVLRVQGHPDCVNVASVLMATRAHGLNPHMELIILTPPQTYPGLGTLQQVICRYRCVRDAERVFGILSGAFPTQWNVIYQYLPDPCE